MMRHTYAPDRAFSLIRDALSIYGVDFDTAKIQARHVATALNYEGLLYDAGVPLRPGKYTTANEDELYVTGPHPTAPGRGLERVWLANGLGDTNIPVTTFALRQLGYTRLEGDS